MFSSIRIALVAALAAVGIAAAAPSAHAASMVSGTVINARTGAAVANAPVRLLGRYETRDGFANASGHYAFYNLQDGQEYQVFAYANLRSYCYWLGTSGQFSLRDRHWVRNIVIAPVC